MAERVLIRMLKLSESVNYVNFNSLPYSNKDLFLSQVKKKQIFLPNSSKACTYIERKDFILSRREAVCTDVREPLSAPLGNQDFLRDHLARSDRNATSGEA